MTLEAILIDDEADALDNLSFILEKYCEGVKVIASSSDALEGAKLISKHRPDIVFLDVEMPKVSGLDLIEILKGREETKIVLTTAYEKYALKAIKLKVFDYLMKPIEIEELQNTLNKARFALQEEEVSYQVSSKITLPTADGFQIIEISNIIRVEGDGAYSGVHLKNGHNIFVSKNLKEFEGILRSGRFMRIHKSHIINLDHVNSYSRSEGGFVIMSDDSQVFVSRSKKEELLSGLKHI